MSASPSDRDETSSAPDRLGNHFGRFIAWAIFTLLFYVLSAGPMWWFLQKTGLPRETMKVVYYPLTLLDNPCLRILDDCVLWWAPIRP